MLKLTRKENETVHIGDNIVIHFLRIRKEFRIADVKIAIDAPKEIRILRGELLQNETLPPAGSGPQDAPDPDDQ